MKKSEMYNIELGLLTHAFPTKKELNLSFLETIPKTNGPPNCKSKTC